MVPRSAFSRPRAIVVALEVLCQCLQSTKIDGGQRNGVVHSSYLVVGTRTGDGVPLRAITIVVTSFRHLVYNKEKRWSVRETVDEVGATTISMLIVSERDDVRWSNGSILSFIPNRDPMFRRDVTELSNLRVHRVSITVTDRTRVQYCDQTRHC